MSDHEHQQVELMTKAFRSVLSEGLPAGEEQRSILIKKIPIICQDIMSMKIDIRWIKWLAGIIFAGILANFLVNITR